MIRIGLPLPFNLDCPGRQSMAAVCSRDNIEARIACGANIWQLRNRIASGNNQKIKQSIDYDYYLSTDWDISYSYEHIERVQ